MSALLNEQVIRPLLQWHGGKFRMAHWIQSFFPPHRVYCEPFSGAASVLLTKPRVRGECVNDLDGEIVNLFRVLQDGPRAKELIRLLTLTPFARTEYELAREATDDPVERARRLCVLSFMGFSSVSSSAASIKTGFRSRSISSGRGPAQAWMGYPETLRAVVERLRGVTIESRPALEVIPLLDTPETLFYVDPPYPRGIRKSFGAYRHELTDAEHEALADCLHGCAGYVVISGYRCALYDRLFDGWARMEKETLCDHGYRRECLWLSPRTAETMSGNKQLDLMGVSHA